MFELYLPMFSTIGVIELPRYSVTAFSYLKEEPLNITSSSKAYTPVNL